MYSKIWGYLLQICLSTAVGAVACSPDVVYAKKHIHQELLGVHRPAHQHLKHW